VHRLFAAIALLTWGAVALAEEPPPPTAPVWLVAPQDPPPLVRPPTYIEQHSARVERDILKFDDGYTLERMRERDQLSLYGSTPGTVGGAMLGAAVFSTAVFGAAHSPVRFAFDHTWHLGPAIFDGGGMGAGFGGVVW
jgi:hypothetical protein